MLKSSKLFRLLSFTPTNPLSYFYICGSNINEKMTIEDRSITEIDQKLMIKTIFFKNMYQSFQTICLNLVMRYSVIPGWFYTNFRIVHSLWDLYLL